MKTFWKGTLYVAFVLALSVAHAKANFIYGNGVLNGNLSGINISTPWSVSNSFSVTNNTYNLMTAGIGVWLDPGQTLLSLDWSIGTTPFGSEISSGTSSSVDNIFVFTNTLPSFPNTAHFDVYVSFFGINGMVTPGLYYLTLHNAVSSNGSSVFWDENNGPSVAYLREGAGSGNELNFPQTSEYFALFDDPFIIPETGSTIALLLGATGTMAAFRFGTCGIKSAKRHHQL